MVSRMLISSASLLVVGGRRLAVFYFLHVLCVLSSSDVNTTTNFKATIPLAKWARVRCRISPPRFLAECCKRQLNQVSLVLLYFRLSAFSDLY